jgi:hypothetical protein
LHITLAAHLHQQLSRSRQKTKPYTRVVVATFCYIVVLLSVEKNRSRGRCGDVLAECVDGDSWSAASLQALTRCLQPTVQGAIAESLMRDEALLLGVQGRQRQGGRLLLSLPSPVEVRVDAHAEVLVYPSFLKKQKQLESEKQEGAEGGVGQGRTYLCGRRQSLRLHLY